ncbi:hypothetical protein CIN_16890 [Commensalibacter intestini A911]|uniref:Uncharacterized protein n=1 Tax=Commensalibacter intestini A911 TaxID=1088868 RepID=G6F243_9PROT|nr:hypothetical protein [Commensalibacter intestini]EHD13497.1 hypothetical protein CIN_16890 [Commensalibacter intestini A911]
MSIQLNDPLELKLEEIDIDNYLPSIQFSFQIKAKQFLCVLEFQGEIWIKCDNWDHFVNDLKSLEKISTLRDMNDSFLLQITKKEQGAEFFLSVSYENIQKNIITSSYKMDISDDLLICVKERFAAYPKWW